MIYKSAIARDLNTNSFTVFVILVSISLSVISVRVLDSAASGKIDNLQVLLFLALSIIGALPFILQVTLLIAVLQTFQRLYTDSEMVIWESAKMPLYRWIKVIFPLTLFITVIVGALIFFVRPWLYEVQSNIEQQYKSKQQWFNTTRGVFHNFANNTGTLYIENDLLKDNELQHLFLFRKIRDTKTTKGVYNLIISQNGKIGGEQDSNINFIGGRFYEISAKPDKLLEIDFDSSTLSSIFPFAQAKREFYSMSTAELIKIPAKGAVSELFWRASTFTQTLFLSLIALAFAYSAPRARNHLAIIAVVAIALLYFNLIKICQPLITKNNSNPYLLFIMLHGGVAIFASFFIYLRTYRIDVNYIIARLLPKK